MEIDNDPAYQQMINGELYMESPILQERRREVRTKIMQYNQIADSPERNAKMKSLLRSVGDRFFVEPTFEFSYGVNITIGDHFYANHGVTICDEGLVKIGNDCKFGPKVGLYTPNIHWIQTCGGRKRNERRRLRLATTFGSAGVPAFYPA